MATNWSESEVRAAVEDYFSMLRLELTEKNYNKSEHRRTLITQLDNRTAGSVELKHQNISAVLTEMGIPCIDGYKPRYNYQRSLLPTVVSNYLLNNPEFQSLLHRDSEVSPAIPTVEDLLATMESPPARDEQEVLGVREISAIANPVGVNYLKREAENQILGDAGEQFVINFERARLIHAGREALAERIEQVSVTVGPSAGFDVRSFDVGGTDRFIEVKTTKYGKNTPFFVTPNELRFSKENSQQYFLYRIFRFRSAPRLFSLSGYLEDQCVLKPSEYKARVG